MRGERGTPAAIGRSVVGSSPHARGTRPGRVVVERVERFIPACAGNAGSAPGRWPAASVHPRMRGERTDEAAKTYAGDGSSPHARGTLLEDNDAQPARRFIPACAGNAPTMGIEGYSTPVHPRMRGERPQITEDIAAWAGSSPHARGTLGDKREPRARARFIPACAGNAMGGGTWWTRSSVHPRMRGERIIRLRIIHRVSGSSPHARGTRLYTATCTG